MNTPPLFQKALAEGIGTFSIVFAGCGSIMVSERFPHSVPAGAIPLVFGLVVAAMIYAIGHISGAHFNPAVTLAFAIARHFPKNEVLAYWFTQFSGAIFAIFLLWFLLPSGQHFGQTLPSVLPLKAFVWEIILSFFLMFVIVSVATDARAVGMMAGASIGITVMFCAFVGGPVTGASMNPARTLAPALFSGHFPSLWIYFLGPMIGTSLAAVTYNWVRCGTTSKPAKGCC